MAKATVVVVSWNGEAYLGECLAALLAETSDKHDVIVVDNGSSDGSVGLIRERFPQVKLIENGRNLGFAGACNVGLRATETECCVLVNQDVAVDAAWLDGLLNVLTLEGVGIVGSKLSYPDGTIQHAGATLSYPLAHPDHRGYREPDRGQWDEPLDVDFVTGASIGLKRSVLDRIGLLDEGFYPGFYEDVDLCQRARAAGYRVVYAPASRAVHHETTSLMREGTDYHRWMGRGRLRLVLKHYTTAQFHEDFVPAERVWLRAVEAPPLREGQRMAYLDTLLALRSMRGGTLLLDEAGVAAVAEALIGLRGVLTGGALPARALAGRAALAELPWHLEERPFRSAVPLLGPLIARFREVWNNVATKWYVRPLIDQQGDINRRLVSELDSLWRRVDDQREEVTAAQEIATALDREAVDARRLSSQALHALREELTRLQSRVLAAERAIETRQEPGDVDQ